VVDTDVVRRPAVVLVELESEPENGPAVVVPVVDDGPVSDFSPVTSSDEVHSADSRHDAVSDPELVAAVVSSSVPDSVPSAEDVEMAGA
jgi:hypothetical protein